MNNTVKAEKEEKTWGGALNEFLWICAGVNRKILRQCPTDYAKYAGIGGTILFTALMAMLSGGYAINFVFDNIKVSIAFGIFWGALIFNLDRFIVNTMYSDGKVTISWQELKAGLPRIIMAIFLGIVISTPLEMKIFKDRIDSQMVKDNIARTNDTRKEAEKGNQTLIERRNALEKERDAITSRLAKANQELKEEGEGAALSGIAGHGPIYEDKLANKNAIAKELGDWDYAHSTEMDDIRLQIKTNQEKAGNDIKSGFKEKGFCVRYEAFSNVKADNPALQIVSIFIMLLFVIIETVPTFFKMMIASGPYDDFLRAEMHEIKVMSEKRISDINDDINTSVMISTAHNKNRLEAEALANKELLAKISQAQADILSEAIALWRAEELQKVRENPSLYIHSGNTPLSDGPTIAQTQRTSDNRTISTSEKVENRSYDTENSIIPSANSEDRNSGEFGNTLTGTNNGSETSQNDNIPNEDESSDGGN